MSDDNSSDDNSTGLWENLRLVYQSYGGFSSLVVSGYFWVAAVTTALCWRTAFNEGWVELAIPVLPTLAGFSIAAYAVFFSVLSEGERAKLQKPSARLNGRAPLLILASSVSHAVFVQISAILVAIIFSAKPFPTPRGYDWVAEYVNYALSLFGLFLTVYGIILILAAVLSIFRILHIKSGL
ncbi:hypothetical protein GOC72_28425 [Sinorhizobium medicae]|nr:hypothetical protein [Sinorhizobium meliloti]MDW9896347.1 hypothetical protein [Sinorhizobium meliloti]MDX0457334.1 hypothetical protein [Sinorhizobium medicae]